MLNFILFTSFLFAFLTFSTPYPGVAIFYIILCFLSMAYTLYLLGATFMAIIILIVYVGAVAMLFVFCVMLFDHARFNYAYVYFRVFGIIFTLLFLFAFVLKIYNPIEKSKPFRIIFYENFSAIFKAWPKLDTFNQFSRAFEHTFLESFSSFFFSTNFGVSYIVLIGFFLFLFTIGVTYIFYFTKK